MSLGIKPLIGQPLDEILGDLSSVKAHGSTTKMVGGNLVAGAGVGITHVSKDAQIPSAAPKEGFEAIIRPSVPGMDF